MHIVVDGIIYEQQRYGGIPRIFSEILPRMCDLDAALDVTLLTSTLPPDRVAALPAHARIHHPSLFPPVRLIRSRRLWWITPRVRALAQQHYLKRDRRGLWHSTYYTQLEPWDGPVVVTVADMIYERYTSLFTGAMNDAIRKNKRRCVQRADRVICISDVTKQEVLQFYDIDPAKVAVVPLAYNREVFHARSGEIATIPFDDVPFLLYVGGRTHYKNFAGLAQAYSAWPRRRDVPLVVVGSPWLKHETRMLADLGIETSVHLLTGVNDNALAALYHRAAAFVYPSLYEGFGIPLLEAMACGCPVVASRIPSTVEVAGELPFYFDPQNRDSCLNALEIALSEGRNPERMHAGLALVRNYSWDATARGTLAVYRDLAPGT